ncbi:NPCBM/NEW2 domain-containing protein [Micromonospora sp. URMC 103]|uniref:NPCBM/NEW2 domain-containing protein n=1 Tax=Micromonospora sp. URMC 103 TaxID=3423406 RepID=UPI003F1BFDFD
MRTVITALALALAVPAAAATPSQGAPPPPEAPPSQRTSAPAASELARTPPLGWNSWNTFGCDINEKLIRDTADAIVSSGMAAAGYEYVNIDDCWAEKERDPVTGTYVAHHERFPSGIKALADYVHAKGLKLGIYTSAGTETCARTMPGSLGHEDLDAQTFADWGVDYLKYDNCNNQGVPAQERYQAMGDALRKTGRPIVYSICEWGENDPWLWGDSVGGDLWRTTGDITDSWSSVMSILDQQVGLEAYSGPSAWNDPDMLEVGNPGLTQGESRAHMSLWALLNAPLIAGNDVRSMPAWARNQLTDPDVLAVNQDWSGRQGAKLRDDGDSEVWTKRMSDGSAAVVLLNRASAPAMIGTTATELGLPRSATGYRVRDLWTDTTSASGGRVRAQVPGHGAVMVRVSAGRTAGLPPMVAVDVTPAQPYVEGSEANTVTVTVHNDGTTAVTRARLALAAPVDWTVTAIGPTQLGAIAPGRTGTAAWRLSADRPDLGPVNLTASASWVWRNRVYGGSAAGQFTVAPPAPAGTSYLSDLTWLYAENGWGPVERDLSNGETAAGDGEPLTIAGTVHAKGLGSHAPSRIGYFLDSRCSRFTVTVGIDDEVGDRGRVRFEVWGDGVNLATAEATGSGAGVPLDVAVSGVDVVELRTDPVDGQNYDHADWATPVITCA